MNIGIDGMEELRIEKEHRHLGIGIIGMAMMMMMMTTTTTMITTLDIDEGGLVTVLDQEAESVKETHLVVRATLNMIHHPRSDVEPTEIQALHHQGRPLETKALTDMTMIQELYTDI
jgi:hypothetical protein